MRLMRSLTTSVVCWALLGIGSAMPAAAQTSVNFDSLNDGDSVAGQFSGLTFSNATALTAGFSLNELGFPPHSGSNVATDSSGPVTILFSPGVNSFSAYFTYSAAVTVAAFDSTGKQLASKTSSAANNAVGTGSPNEQIAVSSTSLIAKVVITGASSGGSFAMDDVVTTITPTGGGGGTIPTHQDLTTLSASPASLIFNQTVGGAAPPTQQFTINAASGKASFTVVASDPWITIVQQNAVTGSTVTIAVDGSALTAAAEYDGSLIFTSAQASNSPFVVPVTLLLHPSKLSKFSATPSSLTFNQLVPGPNPPSQTFTISASPSQIAYTATASDPWIFASPQSGTTGTNYSVRVSGANLKPGNYTGSITFNNPISATNDGFQVPVTLQVGSTVNGIVGAGAFTSSMTSGTIGAIFGQNLGSGDALATTIPLPFTLGGTSVTVGGLPAALYYSGKGQINFQIPTELGPGTYQVVVTVGTTALPPFSITLGAAAPGVFQVPGDTQAASLNVQDGSYNGPNHGAVPGSYIEMFLTGFGPTNPLVPTGAAPPSGTLALIPNVTATIGGQSVTVQFAGLTPGLVGLGQVNLQIPSGLSPGKYPVVISIGGVASAPATIYVGSAQ